MISISVVYFCFLCIDRYVKIKDLILLLINQLTLLDCPKSCRQFSFEWKLEKLEASWKIRYYQQHHLKSGCTIVKHWLSSFHFVFSVFILLSMEYIFLGNKILRQRHEIDWLINFSTFFLGGEGEIPILIGIFNYRGIWSNIQVIFIYKHWKSMVKWGIYTTITESVNIVTKYRIMSTIDYKNKIKTYIQNWSTCVLYL